MELRHLRTFQKVATFYSFSRAAENLHLAQSTISAHIKALEDELGIPLFDRLGRQVILTGAGELLFNQSKRLLAIEEETLTEITSYSEPKGSLTIRVPQTISTYFLPSVLKQYRIRFPKVHFEFIGCTFSVESELKSGSIDLAFLMTDSFEAPNLNIECLSKEQLLMVTHPQNPILNQGSIGVREIGDQTLLLAKTDCSYRKQLERMMADEKVEPTMIFDFNSIEAIKQSVIAGVGITLIPRIAVADELKNGKLVVVENSTVNLKTSLLMIWHKDKWISPILKAFLDVARERITSV